MEDDSCHSYGQRIFSSEKDADAAIYLLRKWTDGTFYRNVVKVIVGTENYRGIFKGEDAKIFIEEKLPPREVPRETFSLMVIELMLVFHAKF